MRKPVPFEFVLEAIEPCAPYVRPMFGWYSVYVGELLVLCLWDRADRPAKQGVWVATVPEHRESLASEFPSHRVARTVDGRPVPRWVLLPSDHPGFEADALRAAELVVAKDPRVGHVPLSRGIEAPPAP